MGLKMPGDNTGCKSGWPLLLSLFTTFFSIFPVCHCLMSVSGVMNMRLCQVGVSDTDHPWVPVSCTYVNLWQSPDVSSVSDVFMTWCVYMITTLCASSFSARMKSWKRKIHIYIYMGACILYMNLLFSAFHSALIYIIYNIATLHN